MKSMQVGQVVDFCIAYNDRQKAAEEEMSKDASRPNKKKKKLRMATQAEIDAFLG